MKAATYARFSTDRQTDSSIADQVRVCTEYAAREGMQVTAQFEDQGISGAAIGNRPGARAMMEAALARRFDVLLVMDLSRLSRSQADLPKMIDRLVAKGVRVVGVQDGYDSGRKGHKLQAGLSGIIGEAFREMVKEKTHAALETRARDRRPTGGKCFGYREGIIEAEAAIVCEIFERYAGGQSCRSIAADLNARGVPSPGSAWVRTERRCAGWMGSAIRAMLRNVRYTGLVRWNASEWVKDPDSGRRIRRERPRSDWHEYRDEALRIVPEDLWRRVARRIARTSENGHWGTTRGKPRYLLSGLLRCEACGAHYVITNATEYSCSGYVNGRACANGIRVRRDDMERIILDPVRHDMLAPERVALMAKEMQDCYRDQIKVAQHRATEAPRELQELGARIERLRERLRKGDPDMPADELQAAIDRAEGKRRELEATQPMTRESARILPLLTKAAALYRRQVAKGLDGNEREALKARVTLRELFGGKINLKPEPDGSLWAEGAMQPAVLLALGNSGSGGRI